MEICVDSLESARNAIEGGASRLELCSALSEGGLTPTAGLIKLIKSFTRIPIYAMIRVRSGDFVYSREEMEVMLHDLKILKDHKADGFVFGALKDNYEIDVNYCKEIISAAHPLPVTFHRAFDEVEDPSKSLEILVDLGFERILTSGQRNTAEEGLEIVGKLVKQAGNRIIVMPGSGIGKDNIRKIKLATGAKEFHASAKIRKFIGGKNKVKIGAESNSCVMVADSKLIKEMVDIIKNVSNYQSE